MREIPHTKIYLVKVERKKKIFMPIDIILLPQEILMFNSFSSLVYVQFFIFYFLINIISICTISLRVENLPHPFFVKMIFDVAISEKKTCIAKVARNHKK